MKKRIISLLLAIVMVVGILPVGVHAHENNEEAPAVNGVYEIGNADQLLWFAEQINTGAIARDADAKLTADIDLGGREWTTICSTDLYYKTTVYGDKGYEGTFDGDYHVISDYKITGKEGASETCGLFGTLSGTVRNLGVEKMSFSYPENYSTTDTDTRTGAIVGQMLDGSLVENCYVVDSALTPKNFVVGGVVGCNYAGTIRNCFTYNVTVEAHSRCGNVVSDIRGDIDSTDRPGTAINCYSDASSVVGSQNAGSDYILNCSHKDEKHFASGEVAWLLNGGQTEGPFKQKDNLPAFEGDPVYRNTCGEEVFYSTTEGSFSEHTMEGLTCVNCGSYSSFLVVTEENCRQLDLSEDYIGYYAIADDSQFYRFAEELRGGNMGTFKVVLVGDISLTAETWTPMVADGNNVFDGNGHTICIEQDWTGYTGGMGLFATFNYGTMKDLVLTGSVVSDTPNYMGAVAAGSYRATYSNVVSYVTVTNNGTGYTGGLVGYFGGGKDDTRQSLMENCAVYADVTGSSRTGGIVGSIWNGRQPCDMENIAYVGTVNGGSGSVGAIAGYNGNQSGYTSTLTNAYYCANEGLSHVGSGNGGTLSASQTMAKTAEDFTSGAVAVLLGEAWGQTIGEENYPVIGGAKIYYGYTTCKDDQTVPVYTNDETATGEKPEHSWQDATCIASKICSGCGTTEGELAPHSFDETGICSVCGALLVATITREGVTTGFASIFEAAQAAAEGETITILENVTIGEDETLAFKTYAYLAVAEGKTVTCEGTVTIGGKKGVIFENTLFYLNEYYDRNFSFSGRYPVYRSAGEGYVCVVPNWEEEIIVFRLHNATLYGSDAKVTSSTSKPLEYRESDADVLIRFSGENTLMAREGYDGSCGIDTIYSDLTIEGDEDAVLNIYGGIAAHGNTCIRSKNLYITDGTINLYPGTTTEENGTSTAIHLELQGEDHVPEVIISEEATVTIHGDFTWKIVAAHKIEGKIDAMIPYEETDEETGLYVMGFRLSGALTVEEDDSPFYLEGEENILWGFAVTEGNSLTVAEGVTFDLSKWSSAHLDLSGTVINKGTIKLPADFPLEKAPKGGMVYIGEKGFVWKDEKWVCLQEHSILDATCTLPQRCELCEETWGEALGHDMGVGFTGCSRCDLQKTLTIRMSVKGPTAFQGHIEMQIDGVVAEQLYTDDSAELVYTTQLRPCAEYVFHWRISAPETSTDYAIYLEDQLLYSATGTSDEVENILSFNTHAWDTLNCTEDKNCIHCDAFEAALPQHSFVPASCDKPSYCVACGVTTGEPTGHSMVPATCDDPITCSVCGATEGEALGHTYVDGICKDMEGEIHYELPKLNEDGYYMVSNVGQLFRFAELVNEGATDSKMILMTDIDLADHLWVPIGYETAFAGVVDGNGHTVSNMGLASGDYAHNGFVGYMVDGGIKNLTVTGHIEGEKPADSGILVGNMEDSVLYNCATSGSITVTALDEKERDYGGLVGHSFHSVIVNCETHVDISVFTTSTEVMNQLIVGGIAGYMDAGYDEPVCILNSFATGDITVVLPSERVNYSGKAVCIGGIAGYMADDGVNNYYIGNISVSGADSDMYFMGMAFGKNQLEVSVNDETYDVFYSNNLYPDETVSYDDILGVTDGVVAFKPENLSATEGGSALINLLNTNMQVVRDVVEGHKGILTESQWADLFDRFGGELCVPFHWVLEDGIPVHCPGQVNENCYCETCGQDIHLELTDIPGVKKACYETGLTTGKHCLICDREVIAQEVIPAGHTKRYFNVHVEYHEYMCIYCESGTDYPHEYVDGKCICGKQEPNYYGRYEWSLKHSLSLESDISLNYIMPKSELTDYDVRVIYVECIIPVYEGNELVSTKTVRLSGEEKGDYYYFTLKDLTAVQMYDRITATLYVVSWDNIFHSSEDRYSIASYAYSKLEDSSSSESLKTLCANLLRYGATAQTYKGYRTDALADREMTEAHKSYLTDLETVTLGYTNSVLDDLADASVEWKGKALSLDSTVCLKFIFSLGTYTGPLYNLNLRVTYTDTQGAEKTVTLKGTAKLYNEKLGYYAFTVDTLLAAELRSVVSVQIYKGETPLSCTMQYSADTYGNNKNGAMGDLCKALFAYSDSAKAFFAG